MPDAMDRVQQHAEDLTSDALAAHARRHPPRPGLPYCEDEGCGQAIAPARQAIGARLCLDCQTAAEARAVHQRAWAGRR